MSKIYLAFLTLLSVTVIVGATLYFWQRQLVSGYHGDATAPLTTPRAQAEFEAGEIYRNYRQNSEAELNQGVAVEKVMHWMAEHPREALK